MQAVLHARLEHSKSRYKLRWRLPVTRRHERGTSFANSAVGHWRCSPHSLKNEIRVNISIGRSYERQSDRPNVRAERERRLMDKSLGEEFGRFDLFRLPVCYNSRWKLWGEGRDISGNLTILRLNLYQQVLVIELSLSGGETALEDYRTGFSWSCVSWGYLRWFPHARIVLLLC